MWILKESFLERLLWKIQDVFTPEPKRSVQRLARIVRYDSSELCREFEVFLKESPSFLKAFIKYLEPRNPSRKTTLKMSLHRPCYHTLDIETPRQKYRISFHLKGRWMDLYEKDDEFWKVCFSDGSLRDTPDFWDLHLITDLVDHLEKTLRPLKVKFFKKKPWDKENEIPREDYFWCLLNWLKREATK